MPLRLPEPPKRPVLFDIQRPASPTYADAAPLVPHEGIELTVHGLERSTPQSASDHLRKLLADLKASTDKQDEHDVIDALVVHSADTRHALDCAYLSLNPQVVPHPRADVLQAVRKTLQDRFPHIRVSWRAQAGPDRSRRLTFTVDGEEQAQGVSGKLTSWLAEQHFPVLTMYTSHLSGVWRIIVDLVDPCHVDAVYHSPPAFDDVKYHLTRARVIQPSYGYQITVLRCRDWQCAQTILDLFIRQHCCRADGEDPIVFSSMEYEGEVYTAILLDWDSTLKVVDGRAALKEFLNGDSAGRFHPQRLQPGLLYGLNSSGLYPKPESESSECTTAEVAHLRQELETVRSQGQQAMKTMFTISEDTNRNVASLGDRLDRSTSAMSTLVALQSLTTQSFQAEMAVNDLRQERNQCEMILLFTDLPDDVHQRQLLRIRECDEQLAEKRAAATRLRARQDVFSYNLMTTLGPTAPAPALMSGDIHPPPGLHPSVPPHPPEDADYDMQPPASSAAPTLAAPEPQASPDPGATPMEVLVFVAQQ
ncbi:hypothetical protein LXA43DRAFT_1105809 [Ganoderma leucocontextum]|nr:hypothetical protein LXA43DRAFT_1105809 [Ganoderma leucocontextum]